MRADTDMASWIGLGGRVAVVTGAGSGIGAGVASVLAKAGAHVIVADRHEDGARRVATALRDAGRHADWIVVDVAEESSVVGACKEVTARHGAPWLLVNNAGVHDREELMQATVAEWDRILTINARGPFLMVRECAKAMVAAGKGGRIVNIASNCVLAPMVMGHSAYASSKGALVAFSQVAAFELVSHHITVNSVLPGGVYTPGAANARGPTPNGPARNRQPPLGICEPEDIAGAVLFFATPAARFITNQSIAVDAGFSLT